MRPSSGVPNEGEAFVANFVGTDHFLIERLRIYCKNIRIFSLRFSARPIVREEVDCYVVPVQLLSSRPPQDRLRQPSEGPFGGMPTIAYGEPEDIAFAFLRGCSDYLRAPWNPVELELRMGRVIADRSAKNQFTFGSLTLCDSHVATPFGRIRLNHPELCILKRLIEYRGRPVSREVLAYSIWGKPPAASSRAIDVHVSALRRKLSRLTAAGPPAEGSPAAESIIRTVRGQGYVVHESP